MEEIRLQKFLANAGICSRRKAEELILNKKVKLKIILRGSYYDKRVLYKWVT